MASDDNFLVCGCVLYYRSVSINYLYAKNNICVSKGSKKVSRKLSHPRFLASMEIAKKSVFVTVPFHYQRQTQAGSETNNRVYVGKF